MKSLSANHPQLAKLSPPRINKVLARARLFKELDDIRQDRSVVWISAPAGSGKTTLIASYLQHKRITPLWYQIDGGDLDMASFFFYLGQAGNGLAPQKEPLPLLTPEYLHGIPTFTRNFFRELFSRLKSPGVIVFDNFQEVSKDAPLHDLLPIALNQIPDKVTVVFISRVDPPDQYISLKAKQQMQVLSFNQLSLTLEESNDIVKLHWGEQHFDSETLKTIHEKTHGWTAGLILSLEQDISQLSDIESNFDPQNIFSYFASEIFNRLDNDTQRFMMLTSLLPIIQADQAEELTNNHKSKQVLDDLVKRNYFTIQRADSTNSYDYHPLFRAFLLSKLELTLPDQELNSKRTETARIIRSTHPEEAILLNLRAKDFSSAIPLLLQHAQEYAEQGRAASIYNILIQFPNQLYVQVPWLRFWLGMCQLLMGNPSAKRNLEASYQAFKSSEDILGVYLSWATIVDAIFLEFGDFSQFDPWLSEIDDILKNYPNLPNVQLEIQVNLGIVIATMFREPTKTNLNPRIEFLEKQFIDIDNPALQLKLGAMLIQYYTWWSGEFHKAQHITKMLESSVKTPHVPNIMDITWYSYQAVLGWMTSEIENCIANVNHGLALSEKTGIHMMDFMLIAQACWAYLTSEQFDEAQTYIDKLGQVLQPNRYIDGCQYEFFLFMKAQHLHDIKAMVFHARKCREYADKAQSPWFDNIYGSIQARLEYEQNNKEAAYASVENALKMSELYKSMNGYASALLTKAEFIVDEGDIQAIGTVLTSAIPFFKNYGLFNWGWWRSDYSARICYYALQLNIETEYVKEIIRRRKLLAPELALLNDIWPFPIKLYTLNRFSLLIDDTPISFSGKAQKRPLDLLKALIAFGGREVSIEKLTEALWPDTEGDKAYQSFNMALKRLRDLLQYKEALILSEGKLTLDNRYAWVDVWAFERGVNNVGQNAIEQQRKTLDLYQGHFLDSEANQPWMLTTRERLRKQYSSLVSQLAKHYEKQQDWSEVIALYQRGLDKDPLAEPFCQGLMQAYDKIGNRVEAIKTYQLFEKQLMTQLGMQPSTVTTDLFTAMKTR